jgi:hypothetical protein
VALTEFVITIEPHAEPAMLEEIAGSLVHDLIRVNVFDSCCKSEVPRTLLPRCRETICNGSDKDGKQVALQRDIARRSVRGVLRASTLGLEH